MSLARYKQVKTNGTGKIVKTIYLGKLFERVTTSVMGLPDKVEEKSYLSDKVIVNEVSKGSDLPYSRLSFLHKDRLGSIVSITNDQSIETEWHAFDAFGSPKQGNLSSSGGLLRTTNTVYGLDVSDEEYATNRGFTGHEHLDDVKLIHMNGRVYDPGMGRFLSVDPVLQSPGNSQSLNPYTYLMNNPLAGTDPTGYTACGEGPQSCVNEFAPSIQFASNKGKSGNAPRGSICVTNSGCKVIDYSKLKKDAAKKEKKESAKTGGQAEREQQANENEVVTTIGRTQAQTPQTMAVATTGYTQVDSNKFKNIYWAASAENDTAFKDDIISIIAHAEKNGLSDFSDLDNLAGKTSTPIFLTNKLNGKLNPSMSTIPVATSSGGVIILSMNTRQAIVTMKGGIQSPATGAIHEVNHGINILKGPGVLGMKNKTPKALKLWKTRDNIKVINGPEARAAKAFGEPTRSKHLIKKSVTVSCPTCTK